MIDAACHVGFPRAMAQKLVIQTIKGSVIFAEQALKENQELTTLRHNVCRCAPIYMLTYHVKYLN